MEFTCNLLCFTLHLLDYLNREIIGKILERLGFYHFSFDCDFYLYCIGVLLRAQIEYDCKILLVSILENSKFMRKICI